MTDPEEKTDIQEEMDKTSTKVFWSGLVVGILFSVMVMCCGFLWSKIIALKTPGTAELQVDTSTAAETTDSFPDAATLEKLAVLKEAIDTYYMNEPTDEELVNGLYSGLLDSLGDPYSTYYTVEDLQAILQQTEGIYYGVGAYIGFDSEQNASYITKVMKGTPAEESGLMQNDFIIAIDGEDTIGVSSTDVAKKIRGEEGTTVVVTVYRKVTDETLDITVQRRKIETPTVEYEMLDQGIGYLEITEFDDVTYNQFLEAYEDLNQQGMKALILDLRANPGGNVSTVCDIARQLLPTGLIVYTEDKYGNRTEYKCDGDHEIQIPLAVLVDGNSASASEILAGAIKDYGIGSLIGTTTFGKGIVQRIISISDGTAVKLTVSNYFTPNGNYIHGVGIEPDILIEWDSERYLNDGIDCQKEAAIEYLQEQLQN